MNLFRQSKSSDRKSGIEEIIDFPDRPSQIVADRSYHLHQHFHPRDLRDGLLQHNWDIGRHVSASRRRSLRNDRARFPCVCKHRAWLRQRNVHEEIRSRLLITRHQDIPGELYGRREDRTNYEQGKVIHN